MVVVAVLTCETMQDHDAGTTVIIDEVLTTLAGLAHSILPPPTSTGRFPCTGLSPDRLDGYLAQRMGLCTTPNIVSSTRVDFSQ